jgi:beta-glucosidase-like glycosyl hydrolase
VGAVCIPRARPARYLFRRREPWQGLGDEGGAGNERSALLAICAPLGAAVLAAAAPPPSAQVWVTAPIGNPIKMHANRELLTDVLKRGMGFDGFVISDWEAVHQLPGAWEDQVRAAVNAGVDMMMEPNAADTSGPDHSQRFETTLLDEVNAVRVSQARIDDAVSRILEKKFELGLFEQPYTDRTHIDEIGSRAHRRAARRAPRGRQVAGAAQEQAPRAAAPPPGQALRGGLERGQHRQPGRRLDDHLAGQLDAPDPRGHDPPTGSGTRSGTAAA